MAKGDTIRTQPESGRRGPKDVVVGDLDAPLLLEDFAPDFADDLASLADVQEKASETPERVVDVAAAEKEPEARAEGGMAADGGAESDITFLLAMALDRGDAGAAEVLTPDSSATVEDRDGSANGQAPATEVQEQKSAAEVSETPLASDAEDTATHETVPDGFLATMFTAAPTTEAPTTETSIADAPPAEAPPATDTREQDADPTVAVEETPRVLPERIPDKSAPRRRRRLVSPLIGVGVLLALVMSAVAGVAAFRFRTGESLIAADAPLLTSGLTSGNGATAAPAAGKAPKAKCHGKQSRCAGGTTVTTGAATVQGTRVGSTAVASSPAAKRHQARHRHHRHHRGSGKTDPGSGGGPSPEPAPEEPAQQNCSVGQALGWDQHPEKQHGHDHADCPTPSSSATRDRIA
ncbi:MAG TPA: hypothetical protein VF660_01255 [Actinomycetota bacterium]